jgi:ferritin-like protein
VLNASALSEDPARNLQLALGVELGVLPPYLYALWSIRPPAEGASVGAAEAAYIIRTVVYEEMLHAGLVANVLNALGVRPEVTAHLMSYPCPLPGHVTTPPWGYDVGLAALGVDAVETFLRIECPEWDPLPDQRSRGWITIGEFYETIGRQLRELPAGAFDGGRQVPLSNNPGSGEMVAVVDLESALEAIDTVVDQGEGHRPKHAVDAAAESDDDHEVAHYYQFKTLAGYFTSGLIDAGRDLHPVIADPCAERYSPQQQAANQAFNEAYTALLDDLQATLGSGAPRMFGAPTKLMVELEQRAAVLRNAGSVPGTGRVAGPTFEYLGSRAGAVA